MTTIGVSIPIPSPYGEQLQQARRDAGDPLADAVPAHVTLCPPTNLGSVPLEDLVAHLEWVARQGESFRMTLRGTGTFRPVSPVVFVAVAEGIGQSEQLQAQVRSGPLSRELEFPYHPHVTIAQGVPAEALDRAFHDQATFTCSFTVDDIHLYEHGTDGVWRPTHEFALGVAASA